MIDRTQVANRILALNRSGLGIGALAKRLGSTIPTIDQIICHRGGRESTYRRILPLLELIEQEGRAHLASILALPTPIEGDGVRPIIRLTEDLEGVVDKAIAALATEKSLFQTGYGSLYIVLQAYDPAPGSMRVFRSTRVTRWALLPLLTKVARFKKYDARRRWWVDALPSARIVSAILNRGSYPGIRAMADRSAK